MIDVHAVDKVSNENVKSNVRGISRLSFESIDIRRLIWDAEERILFIKRAKRLFSSQYSVENLQFANLVDQTLATLCFVKVEDKKDSSMSVLLVSQYRFKFWIVFLHSSQCNFIPSINIYTLSNPSHSEFWLISQIHDQQMPHILKHVVNCLVWNRRCLASYRCPCFCLSDHRIKVQWTFNIVFTLPSCFSNFSLH